MRAVALLVSVSLLGCFPHDHHAAKIAKISEGAALAVGIGLLLLAKTTADCEVDNTAIAMMDTNCNSKATVLSDLGLSLMIGGLVGFIATTSVEEDDDKPPPVVIKSQDAEPLHPKPLVIPTPAPATN